MILTDHCGYRQLTVQEIEDIRRIKFKDVLLATTNIDADDIQDDVFTWKTGKSTQRLLVGQIVDVFTKTCRVRV